jgi:hypothetical protein
VLLKGRNITSELKSNSSSEFACIVHISATIREEETGSEILSIRVHIYNSIGDYRLSSTGQTIQLKDILLIIFIYPIIYVLKELNIGV